MSARNLTALGFSVGIGVITGSFSPLQQTQEEVIPEDVIPQEAIPKKVIPEEDSSGHDKPSAEEPHRSLHIQANSSGATEGE